MILSMANSPQFCERPTHAPSSHIIFHVVRSPAAPTIQLNVISVPDSKPSSSSATCSPFLCTIKKIHLMRLPQNILWPRDETYLYKSASSTLFGSPQSFPWPKSCLAYAELIIAGSASSSSIVFTFPLFALILLKPVNRPAMS